MAVVEFNFIEDLRDHKKFLRTSGIRFGTSLIGQEPSWHVPCGYITFHNKEDILLYKLIKPDQFHIHEYDV